VLSDLDIKKNLDDIKKPLEGLRNPSRVEYL
jgi:hypothetical protein